MPEAKSKLRAFAYGGLSVLRNINDQRNPSENNQELHCNVERRNTVRASKLQSNEENYSMREYGDKSNDANHIFMASWLG